MKRGIIQPLQTLCLLLVVGAMATCSKHAFSQISDPRDISGNVLWLDGSDVDGDFVAGGSFLNGTTWVDKSSAQNANASQTDVSALPAVSPLASNNLSVVDFDGDDFMDVSSAAFGMLQNVEGATMIGVLATDLASSNRGMRALMVSSGSNAAATRAGINLYDGFGESIGGTGDFGLAGRRLDSDGYQRINGGDIVVGELATMTGLFDYQGGEVVLLVNGEEETRANTFQTPGSTSDTASLNIRLGADAGALRGFFNGQIAELIVYGRVLTNTELASVESYIAAKWTGPNSVLLGDVNLDEVVDFSDIPSFISVLTSGIFQDEADIDRNGAVNFSDIPPFIEILTGQ